MRPQRTKEELADAAAHLQYEFWMLVQVAQAIASGIAERGWLANALLESFVIHFRSLVDFFYPSVSAKVDDVLASDYFGSPDDWARIRPLLSETLTAGKARAHKEIAHLTYARLVVTPETKPWAVIELAKEIEILMTLFNSTVCQMSDSKASP